MENPPFSLVIQSVIIEVINRIIEIDTKRGGIPRAARSRLALEAQIYQDLIDKLFYKMVGLTEAEAIALETKPSLICSLFEQVESQNVFLASDSAK